MGYYKSGIDFLIGKDYIIEHQNIKRETMLVGLHDYADGKHHIFKRKDIENAHLLIDVTKVPDYIKIKVK